MSTPRRNKLTTLLVKTPARTTAVAFPRYAHGEVLSDSVALRWSGIYVRHFRFPRVVDRFLVPATAEPLISCVLKGAAAFEERETGGAWLGRRLQRGDTPPRSPKRSICLSRGSNALPTLFRSANWLSGSSWTSRCGAGTAAANVDPANFQTEFAVPKNTRIPSKVLIGIFLVEGLQGLQHGTHHRTGHQLHSSKHWTFPQ